MASRSQAHSSASRSSGGGDTQGRTSRKKHTGMNLIGKQLGSDVPFFPMLVVLERRYLRHLVEAHLWVDTLQLIGLGAVPHHLWGVAMRGIFQVLWFFHLPIWDKDHIAAGFTVNFAVAWVPTVMSLALWYLVANFLLAEDDTSRELLNSRVRKVAGIAFHSITGPLAVPIMHVLIAQAFCVDGQNKLFWFPTQACDTGFGTAALISCVFGFVVYLPLSYINGAYMHDTASNSRHLWARSHSRMDPLYLAYRVLAVVLFHYFSATDRLQWYAVYIAATSFLLAVAYIVVYPYFRLKTQQFRVTALLLSCVYSSLGAMSYHPDVSLAFRSNADIIVITVTLLPLVWLFSKMALSRTSSLCVAMLEELKEGRILDRTTSFPAFLPVRDDTFPMAMALQKEIMGDNPHEHEGDIEKGHHFCTAYITSAYLPTDAELSTRFLLYYSKITQSTPTSNMLAFCGRIFTKFMLKFPSEPHVIVAFSHYLCNVAARPQQAMNVLELLDNTDTPVHVRYQAHRLYMKLVNQLNIQSASHSDSLERSKKRHKDALVHMAEFWTYLCADEVDTHQLAFVAKCITSAREEGVGLYQRAISRNPTSSELICCYAMFLEGVMMSEETSDQCKVILEENREKKKARAMGGANKNNAMAGIDTFAQLPVIQTETGGSSSDMVDRFFKVMNIMFAFLVVVLIGIIVYVIIEGQRELHKVDTLHSAGLVRALAQRGAFVAQRIYETGNSTAAHRMQKELLGIQRDFHVHHNLLTYGAQMATYAPHVAYYKAPAQLIRTFANASSFTEEAMSLWTIGSTLSYVMHEVGLNPHPKFLAYLQYNVPRSIALAFNRSVLFIEQGHVGHGVDDTVFYVVLYVFLLSVIAGISILIMVNFKKLNQSQLDIYGLFTYIPRSLLVGLQQAAKQRVIAHDHFLGLKTKEMVEALIGNEEEPQRTDAALLAGLSGTVGPPQVSPRNTSFRQNKSFSMKPAGGADVAKTIDAERVHDKRERRDTRDVTMGSTSTALMVYSTAGWAIILFACTLVGLYCNRYALDSQESKLDMSRQIDQQLQRAAKMVSLAQHLTQFGETELYWGRYRALAHQRSFDIMESSFVAHSVTPEETSLLSELRMLDVDARSVERACLVLTHRGYAKPPETMREILFHTWGRTDDVVTLKDTSMFQRQSSVRLSDTVSDLGLPLADQLDLSRRVLFTDSYLDKNERLLAGLKKLRSMFDKRMDDAFIGYIEKVRGVISGGILTCTVMVCICVHLFGQRANSAIFNSTRVTVSMAIPLFLVLCCAGLLLACAGSLLAGTHGNDPIEKSYERVLAILRTRADFDTSVDSFIDLPRAYTTQKGDMFFYVGYQQFMQRVGIEGILDVLRSLASINNTKVTTSAVTIGVILRQMAALQNITIVLTAASYASNPAHMPEMAGVRWNFRAEVGSLQVSAKWPESVRYTTFVDDLKLSKAQQAAVARRTVFSPRFLSLENDLARARDDVFNTLVQATEGTVMRDKADLESLFIVTAAFGGAALCSVLLLFTVLMMRYFEMFSSLATATAKESEQGTEFGNDYKCKAALLFLALLVSAGVGVALAGSITSHSRVRLLNYASAREALVAQSMVWANTMVNDTSAIPEGKQRIAVIVRDINAARDELYFGGTWGAYAAVGRDASQDSLLFDSGRFQSRRYAKCNATLDEETVAMLHRGVAILYEGTWTRTLGLLATASGMSDVVSLTNELRTLVTPLLDGLRTSTELFEDRARSDIDQYSTIVIIIFAVTIAVTLIEYLVIFKPIVQQLVHEEGGTKLMLGMIPKSVVDAIPEIAEYLETGNVAGDDGQDLADAISDMSTVPVIAIDSKGIILKFSQAAEKTFGYTASEVTGVNIKVLMPPEIARNHDQILSNYRRTGIKHVIDRIRRLKGLRKNGQLFNIELNVREYHIGEDSVYISFIRDLTDELAVQAEDALNKYVCDIATTPIVAIDSMGTVILVNSSVNRVFGYPSEEVIGENVKQLMPSDIAVHHDGYLEAFRRTGIKKIIDKSVRFTAQRKNGEIFNVDLTVREIKTEGTASMFVAYIRDITDEHRAEMQNEVNDIIANLSPLPIIAINEKGTILKFSRAASQVFGYTQEEVNKRRMNVKFLMPEEVAMKHDSYLERYLTTGVKRVVDKNRDVVCKRRTGYFSAILTVKEVRKEGTTPVFLAYLQESTQKKLMEREHHIGMSVRDNASIAIITISTKGIIKEFNPAAEETFGYTRKEIVGQNISILTTPEVAREHDGYLRRYTKQTVRMAVQRSVTARLKNGTFIPVEIAVREVQGNDLYEDTYIGYVRSREAECKLLQACLINDAMSNLSTIPIIAMTTTGTLLRFSAAAEVTWGYTAENVIGQNVKMLMPASIAVQHDEYLLRYKETGVKHVIDKTLNVLGLRKNGQAFPIELSVREIPKSDGEESTYVAYARDLTDVAKALQEKELGLTMSQLSVIPLIQSDDKGNITFANQAACREFQYTAAEFLTMNVRAITPPEVAVHHDSYLSNYKKTRVAKIIGTLRRVTGLRKDGTLVNIEVKLAESQSSIAGRGSTFIAYMRNIATQLCLEEANGLIDAITNLSSVPIIAIDCRGVLCKFSMAAEKAFGYSRAEVEGENIKMLMPEETAEKHDGYLKTYARTRIKTVVDSIRRLDARHKNGKIFPVELTVKELVKEGRESMFVAYIRDATEDTNLEKAVDLADMITLMGTVPMICMTPIGTITKANSAAMVAFQYPHADLIGQNIKILQPPAVARAHDGYLAAYARTGVRTVIDSTRKVSAMRRNGTMFPAEIHVKEIITQSGEKVFIGFVRDLTLEIAALRANSVNDAVSDMSPIPLIVINSVGTINRFSPSAETTFGHRLDEVIGQNVKMLMPASIAVQHDGYLATYLKTGIAKVVNQIRLLPAIKKSGEEIMCEVSVKEVKKDGEETMYIGFLKDATVESRIKLQKMVAESVVDVSVVPVVRMDSVGTVIKFNGAAELLFGFASSEVVGQNIKMLMPTDIAENHDAYLASYLRTRLKRVIDTQRVVEGKKKNNQKFPIELSVREILAMDGQSTANTYTGTIRDLSHQYVMQQATQINDATLDLSIIPLIVINAIGTIIKFSRAAQEEFMYSPDEIIGQNIRQLMPEPHRSAHDSYLKRYKDTLEKRVIGKTTRDLKGVRSDGTTFGMEIRITEITKDGLERMYLGTVRSIEEENSQTNIVTMNDCLHEISPMPLIIIDSLGTCQKFNTAAEDLLGYLKAEVIGKNIKMLMAPEIAVVHDAILKRYQETGIKRVIDTAREVMAKKKNGSLVPIQIGVREIISGERKLYLGYLEDMASKGYQQYASQMSDVLQNTIDTPIIIINDRGIVRRFNKAAEVAFQFDQSQVIGRNVTLLMPERYQQQHDGYLMKYAQTGKKNVVDSTMKVQAETKAGIVFDVDLSVRELKQEDGTSLFIGFVKATSFAKTK